MKKKDKKIRGYLKLLKKDEDWDFVYLLELEKFKLQRMLNYFKKSEIIDTTCIVREISICLKCIDIILEEDKEFKEYLHLKYGNNSTINTVSNNIDFKPYVNYRNERRFFRSDFIKKEIEDKEPYHGEEGRRHRINMYKTELRRIKAMHLYNLIREYKMVTWWE